MSTHRSHMERKAREAARSGAPVRFKLVCAEQCVNTCEVLPFSPHFQLPRDVNPGDVFPERMIVRLSNGWIGVWQDIVHGCAPFFVCPEHAARRDGLIPWHSQADQQVRGGT